MKGGNEKSAARESTSCCISGPSVMTTGDGTSVGTPSPCCGGSDPGIETVSCRDRFLDGWVETPAGPVPRVVASLRARDILGRWKMRWGIGRGRYRIAPRLYANGNPSPESPVLVTANYKMTFDALRKELDGVDAWILVLDTDGVNVWCAAGKGTFGTDEVIRSVEESRLADVVKYRKLILPQLGAPGVSAHLVRNGCGFGVTYGPVYARDIKRFLARGMMASTEMRRVSFPLTERISLAPMEIVGLLKPVCLILPVLFLLAGVGPGVFSLAGAWQRGTAALAVLATGILAGAVATPLLLPWIPWRAFSIKGAFVGTLMATCVTVLYRSVIGPLQALALFSMLPAVSSFVAMNFTGSTPFTSPSGVEKEMHRAIPAQVALAASAIVFWITGVFAG
jgi:CO dehydrogenase/acetyl-CoA synthase delta subunit